MTRIGILGLGEAGSEIARDLVAAGALVRGYDPAVRPPEGVTPARDEADAVIGCELVLSLTTAEQATTALSAVVGALVGRGIVWADLNTSGPDLKARLAKTATDAGAAFADVAIMSPVPGRGLRSPMIASGAGARQFRDFLNPLGAEIETLDAPPGAAAVRKLLRSIFFKGMAAAIVEALRTAACYDLEAWLLENISAELATADGAFALHLKSGSYRHAARRGEEMAAATELVSAAGFTPRISAAARDLLLELASGTA